MRFLLLYLCGFLLCGWSRAQVQVNSVDVWINLTLSGVDPATVDTSGLNSTELVKRLDELASTDWTKYYYLANAYIRSNSDVLASNSVDVQECPVGSYVGPSGLCVACSAGTYSQTPRATRADVCIPCVVGKFSNAIGASNASTCRSCPEGTFSGTSGASSESACKECGSGMTSVSGATGTNGCVCQVGFYRDANGDCIACERGYFCNA